MAVQSRETDDFASLERSDSLPGAVFQGEIVDSQPEIIHGSNPRPCVGHRGEKFLR